MRISKRTSKLLVKIARENNIRASVVNQIIEALLRDKYYAFAREVDQTLGIALGYPYYASDQKNFPGSTEADGVCTGDHVPESLASEAARHLVRMSNALRFIMSQTGRWTTINTTADNAIGDYRGPSKL